MCTNGLNCYFEKDLCKWSDGEEINNLVLVTHGGFLLFLMYFLQLEAQSSNIVLEKFNEDRAFRMAENTGVTRIEVDSMTTSSPSPRRIRIQTITETSHLI